MAPRRAEWLTGRGVVKLKQARALFGADGPREIGRPSAADRCAATSSEGDLMDRSGSLDGEALPAEHLLD